MRIWFPARSRSGAASRRRRVVGRIARCASAGRAGRWAFRPSARSLAPTRLRSAAGFTLIEVMVVIVIIALASAAVMLTLPDGSEKLRGDAERFAGRLAAARDDAILQSRPMAVWVSPTAYGFAKRAQGRWQAIEDRPFATTPWRDGVSANTGGQQLRIAFDGTGSADEPATVTLVRGEARASVAIDAAGRVRIGA